MEATMTTLTATETFLSTQAMSDAIDCNREYSLISYYVSSRKIVREVIFARFPVAAFEIWKFVE
jgi:hypothetical protein